MPDIWGQLAHRKTSRSAAASCPFLDETDGDGIGDSVGGQLIGVEDAVEFSEIGLILSEQRASEDVTQEKNNTDDFVRFEAAGDNFFPRGCELAPISHSLAEGE
jgi:hypothetical protein